MPNISSISKEKGGCLTSFFICIPNEIQCLYLCVMGSGIRKMSDIGDNVLYRESDFLSPILDKKRIIFLKKRIIMSTKIRDSILITNVTDSIKIPIGNYELDDQPYGISIEQLKYHINSGLSTVATTGSYNNLTDKPDLNIYATLTTLNTNYYNKTEIDALITGGEGAGFLKMKFVDILPEKGEINTFYFVKSEFPQEQNTYNEFVWDEKSKSYEIVSKTDYITSKDLPAIYDSQITIQQGSVTKGTFTLNQSGNATINLDAVPSNTRSLLVTYDDGTQETIKVYTA